jgi:hypothetical protein
VKVDLVHCEVILNKPKLAFFNLMILKEVASSGNVFGNAAPLLNTATRRTVSAVGR